MEKEIRESTLADARLSKGKINKANKKHGNKFSLKYKAFNILKTTLKMLLINPLRCGS